MVKDGKVVFTDKPKFDSEALKYEGKNVEVVIRERKNRRSLNLNSYYWAVAVKLLSEHTGYDKDEMHEVLKSMFLRTRYQIKGVWVDGTKSTTKLNSSQMLEYIEEVKRFASTTLGIYIPDPNESEHE